MFPIKSGWYYDPKAHDRTGFILENLSGIGGIPSGIVGTWFTYTHGKGNDRVPIWIFVQPAGPLNCTLYITDILKDSREVGTLEIEPLENDEIRVTWEIERSVFLPPFTVSPPSPMPPDNLKGSAVMSRSMSRVD